jgi:hypothetical protein
MTTQQSEWNVNVMEGFPIWLNVLVWLVIGGSMVYAATAAILGAVNG